jgi:hypothetical protein
MQVCAVLRLHEAGFKREAHRQKKRRKRRRGTDYTGEWKTRQVDAAHTVVRRISPWQTAPTSGRRFVVMKVNRGASGRSCENRLKNRFNFVFSSGDFWQVLDLNGAPLRYTSASTGGDGATSDCLFVGGFVSDDADDTVADFDRLHQSLDVWPSGTRDADNNSMCGCRGWNGRGRHKHLGMNRNSET